MSPNDEYTAIPLSEDPLSPVPTTSRRWVGSSDQTILRTVILSAVLAVVCFVAGFGIGQSVTITTGANSSDDEVGKFGLLRQQDFFPEFGTVEKTFDFPTPFEDPGIPGDKLWNELMPLGAGFLRVPNPRRFDMPSSKVIENDAEGGEIYSLSVTHQLHCLAVIRDVVSKYEKKDKSRFAGDGHEYHCIDYIRQAIMCSADTTLDFADDITLGPDGKEVRSGFTGANSTHQCRDWDAIRVFAIENRAGDRAGIF